MPKAPLSSGVRRVPVPGVAGPAEIRLSPPLADSKGGDGFGMVVGRAAGGSPTTLTFDRSTGQIAHELHADDFARADRFNGLLVLFKGRRCRVIDSSEAVTVTTLTFAASVLPATPVAGDFFSLQADFPSLVTYFMISNLSASTIRYTDVDERGQVTGAAAGAVGQYTSIPTLSADLIIEAEFGSPIGPHRLTSEGAGGEIVEIRVKA